MHKLSESRWLASHVRAKVTQMSRAVVRGWRTSPPRSLGPQPRTTRPTNPEPYVTLSRHFAWPNLTLRDINTSSARPSRVNMRWRSFQAYPCQLTDRRCCQDRG
jgi:hypothetical protein